MSTYREIINMINDEIKLESDDSYFTLDHIKFLCNKYRALLIKQEAVQKKLWSKVLPESPAYQTICIDLKEIQANCSENICSSANMLKSVQKVPKLISEVGDPKVTVMDEYHSTMVTYISRNRMPFVGHNKWLKNFIYAVLGTDGHIYLSSENPQFRYLEKLRFTGVFDNPEEAMELTKACECSSESKESSECPDVLDMEYPIEEYMVPTLIQQVVKELRSAEVQPEDDANNAADDLGRLARYLANNVKSDLAKKIDGTE